MKEDLDQAETYKYLGMEEGEGVQHHKMKVNIRKEYKRRIKLVLKSELNARNKIAAINTLAVPVILYSYGVMLEGYQAAITPTACRDQQF